MLERPDLLKQLVEKHSAEDGTVRKTALAELDAMQIRTSQYNPGSEIPERNWIYRLAKKYWFSDFGVYRGHDHSRSAAPALVGNTVIWKPARTNSLRLAFSILIPRETRLRTSATASEPGEGLGVESGLGVGIG